MNEITITENQSAALIGGITADEAGKLLCELFEKTAVAGVSVDMISTVPSPSDEAAFGFSFADDVLPKVLAIVGEATDKFSKKPKLMLSCGHVKFTVRSDDEVGFAARVFKAIALSGCHPVLVSSGVNEISVLVGAAHHLDLEAKLRGSV